MLTDMASVIIVCVVVVAASALLWLDFLHYLKKLGKKEFHFMEFIKEEQLYLFLLLMFVFLIGGEILLYNFM